MATVKVRGYGGQALQGEYVSRIHHAMPPGFIHIVCNNPALNQVLRLSPQLPKLTGGFGGWNVTQRPRAVGMTTWAGVPPFEMDLGVLYDDPSGVEYMIRQLIEVARGTRYTPPGIVMLDGIGYIQSDQWVIGGLEFGDLVRRNRIMHRTRQDVLIHLIEYLPPDYATLRAGALSPPRPKTVVYKVKKGDTPAKIAKGRGCRWTDIRTLNKKGVIKSANQKLKVGISIMVPVKAPPKKPAPKKK